MISDCLVKPFDEDWDSLGDVVRRLDGETLVIDPDLRRGPGFERGLGSREPYEAVELTFEACLEPGACLLAKVHQVDHIDQTTNSYHLLADERSAYLARHHHVFRHLDPPRAAWVRWCLMCSNDMISLWRDDQLIHLERDRELKSGYAFIGAQGGAVRVRALRLKRVQDLGTEATAGPCSRITRNEYLLQAVSKFLEQLQTIPEGKIPVIVPVFNLVSYAKIMIGQLERYGIEDFIVCDNNSTYPPMVEYLQQLSKGRRVALLGDNLGPRVYVENPVILSYLPDYFIVTDPDLVFNRDLPNNFIGIMKQVLEEFSISKVGFALDIDKTSDKFFDALQVMQWEEIYWQHEISSYQGVDKLYAAPIDTTFCMYMKERVIQELLGNPKCIIATSAFRIAGRFTCEHMGWWKEQPLAKEEEEYYNSRQQWSSTCNEKLKLGYTGTSSQSILRFKTKTNAANAALPTLSP